MLGYTAVAAAFLWCGAAVQPLPDIGASFWPLLMIGGALGGLTYALYGRALAAGDLSLTLPMREMVRHGVRIFRLNFSHADAAYFAPIVQTIRALEGEFGIPLTALADLCGPKTRIGEVAESPRTVAKGEYLLLGMNNVLGNRRNGSDCNVLPCQLELQCQSMGTRPPAQQPRWRPSISKSP